MTRLLHGVLAVVPFLTATAFAQPLQLTDQQLDKVSAGFLEIERSDASLSVVSLWFTLGLSNETTPNFLTCSSCFLLIVSPNFAVASSFNPRASFSAPP
jgi:hypothetical protein